MTESYAVVWAGPAKRAIAKELPEAAAAAAMELIRVLYRIDDTSRTVTIETIRHRRRAYR